MIETQTVNGGPSNGIILPLPYLPSIDFFIYLIQRNPVKLETQETYPKQTCRNRTIIYSANGLLRLSIPVIKPGGNHTKTSEIIIDNKTHWNNIHWKAISSAYNKSPFFLYYKDDFEKLYKNPEGLLIDFNIKLLNLTNSLLQITPNIELTTEYIKHYEGIDDRRHLAKGLLTEFSFTPYTQVFCDRMPFEANLSILDLLFNEGPEALMYLKKQHLE